MEFIEEKYAMGITRGRKKQVTEGIELPNQERIRRLGRKENYKYFGILEAVTIKQVEMKEKNWKEYLGWTRKLEIKLGSRNLISLIVRYPRPFLKYKREELRRWDQKTRKLMTMRKAFYLKDDIDEMYQEKKEKEDSPALKISWMHQYDENYIKKSKERFIATTKNSTGNKY